MAAPIAIYNHHSTIVSHSFCQKLNASVDVDVKANS